MSAGQGVMERARFRDRVQCGVPVYLDGDAERVQAGDQWRLDLVMGGGHGGDIAGSAAPV